MDKQNVIRFSYIALSLMIFVGIGFYYFLEESVWSGFGMSSALMSGASLLHLKFRDENQTKSIESKFTWLLLICMVVGIILIFSAKSAGASNFYIGIGGGITFVSAIIYCIELVIRFLDGIR